MSKQIRRFSAGVFAGIMILGQVSSIVAAPVAGMSNFASTAITSTALPTAGISSMMVQCMADTECERVMASAKPEVSENKTPVVSAAKEEKKSEYANFAVAKVNDYVNIRKEPDEDSERVGKLYANGVATVTGEENGWYKIKSGTVVGYIKSEYLTVGDEKLAKKVGKRFATVTTETLRVRKEASADSSVLGLVSAEDELKVIDENTEGWVGVSIEEGTGYVSVDYVKLHTDYSYAESKEEEEARLKREEEARKAAAEAAAEAEREEAAKNSSSKGQAVIDYACQFVGNPYVYGGTSLTNGVDCSGFVMKVYEKFGVSLPHSSGSLRSVGYGVKQSEMQPGDIICYSGHVALYVGDGTIVHASNRRDGIKYTHSVNYREVLAVRRIF